MNHSELKQKWTKLAESQDSHLRSLRIDAECIPDMFIGLDIDNLRHVLLRMPDGIQFRCRNMDMENLKLEWFQDRGLLLVRLKNGSFQDLFDDLILSMHIRLRLISNPASAAEEFVDIFSKWSAFFDDTASSGLSGEELKGLFGELLILRYLLEDHADENADEILSSWTGPFGRTHDFSLQGKNIEVKTGETDQTSVVISSEFQLQPEPGKLLELVVVEIRPDIAGINIGELISEIRKIGLRKGGDQKLLNKALAKTGLSGSAADQYAHLKWSPVKASVYSTAMEGRLPGIFAEDLPAGVYNVKYKLAIESLSPYLQRTLILNL